MKGIMTFSLRICLDCLMPHFEYEEDPAPVVGALAFTLNSAGAQGSDFRKMAYENSHHDYAL